MPLVAFTILYYIVTELFFVMGDRVKNKTLSFSFLKIRNCLKDTTLMYIFNLNIFLHYLFSLFFLANLPRKIMIYINYRFILPRKTFDFLLNNFSTRCLHFIRVSDVRVVFKINVKHLLIVKKLVNIVLVSDTKMFLEINIFIEL